MYKEFILLICRLDNFLYLFIFLPRYNHPPRIYKGLGGAYRRQNKLVKIVIKDLLNNKNFNKLEKLSQDRGTSIQVLLSSYNLHNGNDDEKK